jgi:glycosyltransferase involved in cell wall biosynthesis
LAQQGRYEESLEAFGKAVRPAGADSPEGPMHVLFIHPNFPAQFGHIAHHLARELRWPTTFLTSIDTRHLNMPFSHLNYKVHDGPQPKAFFNPDSLQALFDHALAVYRGMRSLPQFKPDLVVGHMSYGTMLYLRNLYDCPFVGYYELLPPPFWGEGLVLRKEFPPPEGIRLFNATFHTLTYLHLHACDAGYTPTHFQLGSAPAELRHKLRVIFDGVDTEFFQPRPKPDTFRGLSIPKGQRVVTYVSRGLESARGFDVFMKMAKRVYQQFSDVVFLIAGEERSNYGHELHHIGNQTFKQWVLKQDDYDLSKFQFLGRIPPTDLAALYNLSDLHVYLTVPYVLSWSLIQAMSSGCTVLGSATAPLQEAIDDGVHGLLAGFDDVGALAERALAVLRDPGQFRHLGEAARRRVLERYEQNRCIGQLVEFFQEFEGKKGSSGSVDRP